MDLQFFFFKRLGQVGIRPLLEPFYAGVEVGPGGKQDDGDVAGWQAAFQPSAYFVTVHLRHHHITKDDIGYFLQRYVQACFPVGSGEEPIIGPKEGGEVVGDVDVVFDDEEGGNGGCGCCRCCGCYCLLCDRINSIGKGAS